jgi:DNA-binding NtrC family response regulator
MRRGCLPWHAPHMAIIMVTARGDEMVATEAMKGGASDYITKSQLRSDMMRRVVESAVERVHPWRMSSKCQDTSREMRLPACACSHSEAVEPFGRPKRCGVAGRGRHDGSPLT